MGYLWFKIINCKNKYYLFLIYCWWTAVECDNNLASFSNSCIFWSISAPFSVAYDILINLFVIFALYSLLNTSLIFLLKFPCAIASLLSFCCPNIYSPIFILFLSKYSFIIPLISSGISNFCFLNVFAVLYWLNITSFGLLFLSTINKFSLSSSSFKDNINVRISSLLNKYTDNIYIILSFIFDSFSILSAISCGVNDIILSLSSSFNIFYLWKLWHDF